MRLAMRCGIGVVCAGLAGSVAAEVDPTASLSVVQIRGYMAGGRVFYGSGVVVAQDRVATNCHVTRDAGRITVGKGALSFPATAQRADTRRDLCVLVVPGLPLPVARLGRDGEVGVGQSLYFYGYPHAIGIAYAEARVRALHPFEGGRVIETTADFTFGGSGGGLFDGQGRLVGLATFLSAAQSRGYAIPSAWIAAVEAGEAHEIGPLRGLTFWEDAAALPAFLRTLGK
ncbi:Trypsin-like peptidase domain-containing protein [Methylomagnum ishizawai]|uniref:Trypsin-like peptidase domain-containing protein n=1 Tax=Methylomagnum ishizawai TaxID=1760988 RepID=A0A1Y6D473_9GAMM|nr:serine protease [Methylomagnum ishizawai]SMF95643.1 Trypsin-like peptidase domain-containing protein [Methylomagnum ishizawai]